MSNLAVGDNDNDRGPTGSGRGLELSVLGLFLAVCLSVAALGGAVTSTSVNGWYQELAKPPFNPPDSVFAPVWTTLYVMMAVAAWRVWRQRHRAACGPALGVFGAQLALNLLWSYLFFGWLAIGLALVEVGVLWLAIVATAILFARIDRMAGWLLMPYAAWVLFASVLNGAIWWLN